MCGEFRFSRSLGLAGSTLCTHQRSSRLTAIPGIFAYCSFLTEKERKYVCEVLCNGLARLEYRGYDSAGKFLHPSLENLGL